jgi:hypothetical protein
MVEGRCYHNPDFTESGSKRAPNDLEFAVSQKDAGVIPFRAIADGRQVHLERSLRDPAREKRLSDTLGLVVSIDHRGEGGVVSIRYRDLDQLDDLALRLSKH